MRKNFSFSIINNKDSSIIQTTFSFSSLSLLALILLAGILFFGFVVNDYYHLKKKLAHTRMLEDDFSSQQDEITSQRKQIQNLSSKIDSFKSKLLELNNLEKKLRIIANIEKSSDQDAFFGVGGSILEDLETDVPLTAGNNSLVREMHEQIERLDLAALNQKKSFESLYNHLEEQRNLLDSTPTLRPTTGWISSKFGYRKSPFTGLREFHKGLDIAAKTGTPIVAAANGVVTYAGAKGLLGKVVIIDHGYGMVTRYGHLSKILKKNGEAVKRGDKIGLVGSTGRSTGPHLHYEVRLNGMPVNPGKYILN